MTIDPLRGTRVDEAAAAGTHLVDRAAHSALPGLSGHSVMGRLQAPSKERYGTLKQMFRSGLVGALAAAMIAWTAFSAAAETGQRLIVNEVVIYLGVLPAEIIAEQTPGHHESKMHRGIPGWGDQYHVMVALFDQTNWARITSADVSATLSDARTPGRRVTGPRKQLEPMTIAGSAAYGNYFNIPGNGPYRIDVEIRRSGTEQPIKAGFVYRHAVFSMQPRVKP